MLLLCDSIFTRSALPKKNLITMLFHSNTVNMLCICSLLNYFFQKVTSNVINQVVEFRLFL
jgi:hypothetical protein